MMTSRRRWCRRRLGLLFLIIGCLPSAVDMTSKGDLSSTGHARKQLNAPGSAYEDISVELMGRNTQNVASVDLVLQSADGKISRRTLHPPQPDKVGAQSISWTSCGYSFTTNLSAEITWKWKTGMDDAKKGNIIPKIGWKEMRFSEGKWKVKDQWTYTRLTWPEVNGTQPVAAVGLSSEDVSPAVACLRHECAEVDKLSSDDENCEAFTTVTSFVRKSDERLPSYLYARLENPSSGDSRLGKPVTPQTKRGSTEDIDKWLTDLKEKLLPNGRNLHSSVASDAIRSNRPAGAARSNKPGRTTQAKPSKPVPGRDPPGELSGRSQPASQDITPQRSETWGRPDTVIGPHEEPHAAETKTGAHADGDTNHHHSSNPSPVSNSENSDISNVGNSDVKIYNIIGDHATVGKSDANPESKPELEQREKPVVPSTRRPARSGASGVLSGQQPQTIHLRSGQWNPQGGPLTFAVEANGTLHALLLLKPEPMSLHISSVTGGSARGQLCRRQLTGDSLKVTVYTTAAEPVHFTAKLHQSDAVLSLDATEEVSLSPNRSVIQRLQFPDYDSPLGLTVDTPPRSCLRATVFKQACAALAGRVKDAVVHKYLSSDGYLPIASPDDRSRQAFLRTDWAAPEQCGLPPLVSAAARSLSALISLHRHEDSDVWQLLLLPPLTLAAVLPLLALWLVRAAAARWRRAPPTDDDGVTIREVPGTPRLPRHVPPLTGTDAGKPALTASPAAATAPAPASPAPVTSAAVETASRADYPDLSEEKRQMAAAVAGREPGYPDLVSEVKRQLAAMVAALRNTGSEVRSCPDLSEAQRREVAVADDAGQKERLAVRLGVGGQPAVPSAPAVQEEADASVSLLPDDVHLNPTNTTLCRAPSDASGALLVSGGTGTKPSGPLAVARHVSTPALFGFAVAVLSMTTYFSAIGVQSFLSGDAGACPVSAHYTVMSIHVPGIGGVVNLVPTLAYALCLWYLRNFWSRHASPLLLERGVMWPAPGLEWILLMYGLQSAVGGLCPGQNPCFTSNTFAVAFISVLAVSRVPTVRPALPLAATVAGSALVSADNWLPGPALGLAATAAAVAGHLLSVAFIYHRLLVSTDVGRLSIVQQLQLLSPVEVSKLAAPQLLTAVLGATALSPAGYLGSIGLATLLTTLWATERRKGMVSVSTPFSPYAWLSQLVGSATFAVAVILGELAHSGKLGLLEVSSIGQLLYLISCFSLGLGISPRPLRLQ